MSDQIEGGTFFGALAILPDEDLEDIQKESANFPVPQGSPRAARNPLAMTTYSPAEYEREKYIGRRRRNGALKLKKLSSRHLDIIKMHLQGMSGEDIAATMNCTYVTVSRVLNDPLAQEVKNRVYKDRQSEIDALAGAALEAVRTTLTGEYTMQRKLVAVDKYVKLKDAIGSEEAKEQTAEDVVSAIFKKGLVVQDDARVQINVGKSNG